MDAQMTTTVRMATLIPGGEAVETPIGTLTVPVTNGVIAPADLLKALGDLLRAASDHLLSTDPADFELTARGGRGVQIFSLTVWGPGAVSSAHTRSEL
ncbi:hypothetical protein [Streptomyces sp. NPDC048332]|uniref:hypothetical protein n=1 Tax=Streptomyces sp. NPDC048332 TaxID=3154619 RepID=UPI00342FE536